MLKVVTEPHVTVVFTPQLYGKVWVNVGKAYAFYRVHKDKVEFITVQQSFVGEVLRAVTEAQFKAWNNQTIWAIPCEITP